MSDPLLRQEMPNRTEVGFLLIDLGDGVDVEIQEAEITHKG